MVEPMTGHRLFRWAFASALGPLTGPLALEVLACHRRGDRLGAVAYACAIPAVWVELAIVAAHPWMA